MTAIKEQEEMKTTPQTPLKRQYLRFAFYRINPAFRKLDSNVRLQAKDGIVSAVEMYKERMILLSYSLLATRSDADFMLWQISDSLENFEDFASKILHTTMAPHLEMTRSYLSSVPGGTFTDKIDPQGKAVEGLFHPGDSQYVFVSPLTQTLAWHQLTSAERRKTMDLYENIAAKYPSIKAHLADSEGLDDYDFTAFTETDSPEEFQRFWQELHEGKFGAYILRDNSVHVCLSKDPKLALDSLG